MKAALRLALSLLLVIAAVRVAGQWRGLQAAVRAASPEGLAAAIAIDPTSAEHHYRLGIERRDALGFQDLDAARLHLGRAAELNSYNWFYRLELARAHELAGDRVAAEAAYLEALRLNPHFGGYRWQVANFYLRSERPRAAARALGEAVAADRSYAGPAFDILLRMEGGFEQIDEVWPRDRRSRLELLLLGIRRGAEAGGEPPLDFLLAQWQHLLGAPETLAQSDGTPLVEHLLRRGEAGLAKQLWLEMNEHLGLRDESYTAGTNLVWNGDFELPSTQGPLDWRLTRSEDFTADYAPVEAGPGRGLRVDFLGKQNLDFVGVIQTLVVEPGAKLRLSGRMRGEQLTTDQGPFLQVLDQTYHPLLETAPLRGTSEWAPIDGAFTVPAGQRLIHLRIRRRASTRINNRIEGSFWLDAVRVAPIASTPRVAGAGA